jgi:hypothetical protein
VAWAAVSVPLGRDHLVPLPQAMTTDWLGPRMTGHLRGWSLGTLRIVVGCCQELMFFSGHGVLWPGLPGLPVQLRLPRRPRTLVIDQLLSLHRSGHRFPYAGQVS